MTEEVIKPHICPYRRHLLVCTGPRCTQDGASQALFDSLGDMSRPQACTRASWA